jgi:hypothetical protein
MREARGDDEKLKKRKETIARTDTDGAKENPGKTRGEIEK